MKTYKSGKLPTSFHVIPLLDHWKELLDLTEPALWRPHAYYETTKIFVSKTESQRTLEFFRLYLLPRIVKDIKETKKLNYHLFRALQKGLYRPASWIKGILMPFVEAQDSTLKQAQIISAAIMKTSISNAHAGAAIFELLDLPYSGPLNIILKIFIDKKLALPQMVVQKLVDWFMGFKNSKVEQVPVLWFQTLLSFAKLYKKHLSEDMIKSLRVLVKKNLKHELLSKEINKELLAAATEETEEIVMGNN